MSTNLVKFRIDIDDPGGFRNSISLEVEDHPGTGTIALGERGKPWICCLSFSAEALRAIGRAAMVLADQIQPTEPSTK